MEAVVRAEVRRHLAATGLAAMQERAAEREAAAGREAAAEALALTLTALPDPEPLMMTGPEDRLTEDMLAEVQRYGADRCQWVGWAWADYAEEADRRSQEEAEALAEALGVAEVLAARGWVEA